MLPTRPSVYALSPETPAETIALYILILTEHYFTNIKLSDEEYQKVAKLGPAAKIAYYLKNPAKVLSTASSIEEKRLKTLGLEHISTYYYAHEELITEGIKEAPSITTGGWSQYASKLHLEVEKNLIDFQEKIKISKKTMNAEALKRSLILLLKTTIEDIRAHRLTGKNSELAYEMEKILWEITPVNEREDENKPKLADHKAPLLPEDFYATVIQQAAEEVTLAKRVAERGTDLPNEAEEQDYAPQRIGNGDDTIEINDQTFLQLLANMATTQIADAEMIEKMARAQKVLALAEFELEKAREDAPKSDTYNAIIQAQDDFMIATNRAERKDYRSYQIAKDTADKANLALNGNGKQANEDGYIPGAKQLHEAAQLTLDGRGEYGDENYIQGARRKNAAAQLALNNANPLNLGAQNVYDRTLAEKNTAEENFGNANLALHGNDRHYNDADFVPGALYNLEGAQAHVALINCRIEQLQLQLNENQEAITQLTNQREAAERRHGEESNRITYDRNSLLAQYQKAKDARLDIENELEQQDPELKQALADLRIAQEEYDNTRKIYLEKQTALFELENQKKTLIDNAAATYNQKRLELEKLSLDFQLELKVVDDNGNLQELSTDDKETLKQKYHVEDDRTLETKLLVAVHNFQQQFQLLHQECEDLSSETQRKVNELRQDFDGQISSALVEFFTAQQACYGVLNEAGQQQILTAAKATVEKLQNAFDEKKSGSQILREANDLHKRYQDAKANEADLLKQVEEGQDGLTNLAKDIASHKNEEALVLEQAAMIRRQLGTLDARFNAAQDDLIAAGDLARQAQVRYQNADAILIEANTAFEIANFRLNGANDHKGVRQLAADAQTELEAAEQAEQTASANFTAATDYHHIAEVTLRGAQIAVQAKLDAINHAKRAHAASPAAQKVRQAEMVLTEIQRQYADIERNYSANVRPHLALTSTLLHKRDWQATFVRDSLLTESIHGDKKITKGSIDGMCPSENVAIVTMRRIEDAKLPLAVRGHDRWSAEVKADPSLRSIENRTSRPISTPLARDGKHSFSSYFSYSEADNIRLLGKRPKGTLPNGKERPKSVSYGKNLLAADASDFGVKPMFIAHRNNLFAHTSDSVQKNIEKYIHGKFPVEIRPPSGRHAKNKLRK